MHTFAKISGAAFFLVLAFSVRAEDIPFLDLEEKGMGTNTLGTFSIEFFGNRSKFPNFSEKAERPTPVEGRFQVPEVRAALEVDPDGIIKFDVGGFSDSDSRQNLWLPVLVFTPKEKGKYKIGGTIKFWCDDQEEDNSVNFNVVAISGAMPDGADYEHLSKHNGELDLSQVPDLQNLMISDAVGLTIWRNLFNKASGGVITGLTIEKVP